MEEGKRKPGVERRCQKNWGILRTHRDILTILHLSGPISRSYVFTPKKGMDILNAFKVNMCS